MKKCELCKKVARTYCESDQASLCWDCDYRVHTANFIVAKHTRTLLCHACQNPTPWTGSGSMLGPTVSVCQACCLNGNNPRPQNGNTPDDDDNDDEDEDEDEEDEEEEHKDDDDSENQVVPFSLPTSLASSTASEGSSSSTTSLDSRSRFSYHESNKGEAGSKFRSWKWR